MQLGSYRTTLCALLLLAASLTAATAQQTRANRPVSAVSTRVLLPIMRAEDERRWGDDLALLLADKNAKVRKRAALAAGRIGDERAVPALIGLLRSTDDVDVRQMAAFALGEIESVLGADALLAVLEDTKQPGEVRARAVEALGKIAAALPQTEEARRLSLGQVILKVLAAERKEGATTESGVRDRELELLGLTAVLRARPADAGKVVTLFLSSADPRVRADAANTLARLRAKDGVDELRMLLVDDQSPIARANAAKALGVAEDKESFDALLDRALHDDDLRVRVSAIRALGSLKDGRAAGPLLARGTILLDRGRSTRMARPAELNEILEIATVIGTLQKNTKSQEAVEWLRRVRGLVSTGAPEVEVAMARVDPTLYVTEEAKFGVGSPASIAQGIVELTVLKKSDPGLSRSSEFVPGWIHDALLCRQSARHKSAR